MRPNGIFEDAGVAQFYDRPEQSRLDFDACAQLACDAASVLDLGAGTGTLALRLSEGRAVTAVEPAAAMLDLAKAKPGAARARWIEDDARHLRLEERFDLIVLTGHTFQVFLTDDDQRAVLGTISHHLAPDGLFVFDSRNPAFPGRKERRRDETERRFDHPVHGAVEAWNVSRYDEASGILSYENGYRILATGVDHVSTAQIRYTPKLDIEARISAAGLSVDRWLGEWSGAPFKPAAREIIPVGRLT